MSIRTTKRDPADLVEAARKGDRGALARLISFVEEGGDLAREVGRLTFAFEEVPVKMRDRMAGTSTITAVRSFYYVLHVLLGVVVNILKYQGTKRR